MANWQTSAVLMIGGAAAVRRGAGTVILRRRPVELSRRHLHRLALERRSSRAATGAARRRRNRTGREQRAAAMERRGRRLRPSPDDRERHPRGGGEFRQLRRLDVAGCRPPRHLAAKLPALHRGAGARSAHHGFDGFAAGIHQIDLGLSRHSGERRSPRQGPRNPREIQAAVRCDGKGLWRRPLT